MKTRIIWALVAGASCIVLNASTSGAQSTDSIRGYDGQALRFESSWGNARIIRGADGPVVGTAGWFRSFDVEKLVATSPSAQAEARVYKTNNLRGAVVTSVGAATTAVGLFAATRSSSGAASPILIIGGVGAMAWGAQHMRVAVAALSRSLWWYNRDLARSNQAPPGPGRAETQK